MVSALAARKSELMELCRGYRVLRLEAFGSANGSEFDPEHSDYDFLVEFADLPPGEYAKAYFDFKEELEKLLGRPVDLVIPSAVRNPFFLQGIEQSRTLLYAA
jgi:uncharacterized protein